MPSSLTTDILRFDNSRSWTHSKKVFYSVKVMPPESESELPETTPLETEATPTQTDSSPIAPDGHT